MLWYMARTAIKLFQGLIQLSVETHLNTDKAKLTSFLTTNKKTKAKNQGEGYRGEEQETGENA